MFRAATGSYIPSMTRLTPGTEAQVVRAAADGDQQAWERIVDAYIGLIWTITRNHGLRPGDAADVSQTTWLRLLENIHRIDDPTRIGAWLATTARRECLRTIARNGRQVLVGETETLIDLRAPESPGLDAALLAEERDAEVQRALAELPARCRHLMALLMLDPPPSYEEISAALDMPIGSIGPTRGRCLRRLERILSAEGIDAPLSWVFDSAGR